MKGNSTVQGAIANKLFLQRIPEANHFSTPSPPCPLSHCADLSGLLPEKASHPLKAKPEHGQSQAQLQRLPSLTEVKSYPSCLTLLLPLWPTSQYSPPSSGSTSSWKTPHSEPQGLATCFPQGQLTTSLPSSPLQRPAGALPTLLIYLTHPVFPHLLSFPTLDEAGNFFY